MTQEPRDSDRLHADLDASELTLAEALDARARAVAALGALRTAQPDAFVSLPRDHDVIARMTERVADFPKDAVRAVMTEVLSACARLVAPIEVVYLGQVGGFGHQAARKHFGGAATLRGVEHAEDALAEVERGHASFAILPFETSYDGAVTSTLNLLARSEAKVCAEIRIARAFHLVSQSGDEERVTKIYAPGSALTACEAYLRQQFPRATLIDVHSAMAAVQRAQAEPEGAALATTLAAEESGLSYVARSIEDQSDLETRYVAVGNDLPPRSGEDRTAIALALHDAPGVLVDCLRPFADRKLNIYRLETRPARGWAWRYLILVEVDGHVTDRTVLAAIEELRTSSRYVKVLGSYPIVGE
jgi:chorismate mutase/prephenate dehydratase